MDPSLIADLVTYLARLAYVEGVAEGLTPVQWATLRYFSRANRLSRTPSAYAAFHGTTRATASHAIKSLCDKGYLNRARCDADRRSRELMLTPAGRALIGKDPIRRLESAIATLPAQHRDDLGASLALVAGGLGGATGQPAFGTCMHCARFEDRGGRARGACQLVTEPLPRDERDKLCVHFRPRRPTSGTAVTE